MVSFIPRTRISPLNLLLLVIAVSIGQFVVRNPILFGRRVSDESVPSDFKVFTSHPVLDRVLQEHQSEIGGDNEAYRNHCLRVLSFASHFLQENATDSSIYLMAYALAYHDIGLWTDKVLDYLEPSSHRLMKETRDRMHESDEMQDTDSKVLQSFNNQRDLETMQALILQHHKYTMWKAPEGSLADEVLVNAVRKGDWADASYGIVRFGLTAGHIQAAYDALPDAGFHAMLAEMTNRLSPDSLAGRLKILSIFKL